MKRLACFDALAAFGPSGVPPRPFSTDGTFGASPEMVAAAGGAVDLTG